MAIIPSPDSGSGFNASNVFEKRILVAPLNWGLGHATRCIPLIRALQRMGVSVLLASDGVALALLREEFPQLPSFSLPSYRIQYRGNNMIRNIAERLPAILYAVQAEHFRTASLVRQEGILGILSDNRYGCYHRQTGNVLLTHQLHLKIPNKPLEILTNRILHGVLKRYDAIWVPDAALAPALSGTLSHPPPAGLRQVTYLGPLSRYAGETPEPQSGAYDAAVVLSGPEPQRSRLEKILMEQATALPAYRFIFVLGKPSSQPSCNTNGNITVYSHLGAQGLLEILLQSRAVVCRSGYSSIMDLFATGKPALLIPTPGQTEQEYLATLHADLGHFTVQLQHHIDLRAGLEQIFHSEARLHQPVSFQQFDGHLKQWVSSL